MPQVNYSINPFTKIINQFKFPNNTHRLEKIQTQNSFCHSDLKLLISFITEVISYSKKMFNYRKEYRIFLAIKQLYLSRRFYFHRFFFLCTGFSGIIVFQKQSCACHIRQNYFYRHYNNHEKFIMSTWRLSLISALQITMLMYLRTILKERERTGKTSRVKENNTDPISVARNLVSIQSDFPTEFQSISQLRPSIWEPSN